ncbi:hypothetical protein [Nocardia huaxiensis]|uniref:hypothetical protein n=1 Tax=Nocardia huaxiensis TaxID=2755382 RepID=UPI001E65B283|nr:hypothetical protein [Nocardia huaxiensis]UFS93906.1 hypothetical protein LPY97_24340 [Nocardia huaxiensis]
MDADYTTSLGESRNSRPGSYRLTNPVAPDQPQSPNPALTGIDTGAHNSFTRNGFDHPEPPQPWAAPVPNFTGSESEQAPGRLGPEAEAVLGRLAADPDSALGRRFSDAEVTGGRPASAPEALPNRRAPQEFDPALSRATQPIDPALPRVAQSIDSAVPATAEGVDSPLSGAVQDVDSLLPRIAQGLDAIMEAAAVPEVPAAVPVVPDPVPAVRHDAPATNGLPQRAAREITTDIPPRVSQQSATGEIAAVPRTAQTYESSSRRARPDAGATPVTAAATSEAAPRRRRSAPEPESVPAQPVSRSQATGSGESGSAAAAKIDLHQIMNLLVSSHDLEVAAARAESGEITVAEFAAIARRTRTAAVDLVASWYGGADHMRKFGEVLLQAAAETA